MFKNLKEKIVATDGNKNIQDENGNSNKPIGLQSSSRFSSISSLVSDVGSAFSKAMTTPQHVQPTNRVHKQSQLDIESVSEYDESLSSANVLSKEELYQRYEKARSIARRYKTRYMEIREHCMKIESENTKLNQVMSEFQDKSFRRVNELKENIELDRKAKQDVEENYMFMLEEKDEKINILQLQVNILKEGKDLPPELETKIRENHEKTIQIEKKKQDDIKELKANIADRDLLLQKCKDKINELNARMSQLHALHSNVQEASISTSEDEYAKDLEKQRLDYLQSLENVQKEHSERVKNLLLESDTTRNTITSQLNQEIEKLNEQLRIKSDIISSFLTSETNQKALKHKLVDLAQIFLHQTTLTDTEDSNLTPREQEIKSIILAPIKPVNIEDTRSSYEIKTCDFSQEVNLENVDLGNKHETIIEELNEQNKYLTSQIEMSRAHNKDFESEAEIIEQKFHQFEIDTKQEKEKLHKEITQFKLELENLQIKLKDSEGHLKEKEKEAKQVNEELAEIKHMLQCVTEEKVNLQEKSQEMKENLELKTKYITNLTDLQSQDTERLAIYKEEVETLTKNLEESKLTFKKHQNEIREKQDQIDELSETIDNLTKDLDLYKTALSQEREEKQTKESEDQIEHIEIQRRLEKELEDLKEDSENKRQQLQKEITDIQNVKDEVESKNNDLIESMKTMENEIKKKEDELKAYQELLQQNEEEKTNLTQDIAKNKNDNEANINEKTLQIKQYEEEIEILNKKVEEYKISSETNITNTEKENQNLQKGLNEIRDKAKKYKEVMSRYKAEKEDFQQQTLTAQTEVLRLTAECEDKSSLIRKLEGKLECLNIEFESEVTKHTELMEEMKSLKSRLLKMENENDDTSQQNIQIETQRSKLQETLTNLQIEFDKITESDAEKADKINESKLKIEQYEEEINTLQKKLDEYQSFSQEFEDKDKLYLESQTKLISAEDENKKLQKKIDEFNEAIDASNEKIAISDQAKEELQKEKEQLKTEISRINNEKENIQKKLEGTQIELNNIRDELNSTLLKHEESTQLKSDEKLTLEQSIANLSKEKSENLDIIKEKDEQILTLNNQVSNYQDDLKKYREENDIQTAKDLNEKQVEIDMLKEEVSKLQDGYQSESMNMSKEIEDLQKSLSDKETHSISLNEECTQLKVQMFSNEQELKDKLQELCDLRDLQSVLNENITKQSKEMDELKQNNQVLSHNLEEKIQIIADLKTQLDSLLEQLTNSQMTKSRDCQEKDERITLLIKEKSELEKIKENQELKLDKMNSSITQFLKQINTTLKLPDVNFEQKAFKKNMINNLKAYETEKQNLVQENEELQYKYEEEKMMHEETKQALIEIHERMEDLTNEKGQIDEDRQSIHKALLEVTESTKKLQEEFNIQQDENTRLEEKIELTMKAVQFKDSRFELQYEELKEKNDKYTKEIQQKVEEITEINNFYKKKLSDSEEKYKTNQVELDNLKQQLHEKENIIQTYLEEKDKLKQDISLLKSVKTELEHENLSRDKDIEEAKQKIKQLQQEKDNLIKDNQEMTQKIDQHQSDLKKLKKEVKKYQRSSENFELQVEELKSQHGSDKIRLKDEFKEEKDNIESDHNLKIKRMLKEFNEKMNEKERDFQKTFQEALENRSKEESGIVTDLKEEIRQNQLVNVEFQLEINMLNGKLDDENQKLKTAEELLSQAESQQESNRQELIQLEDEIVRLKTELDQSKEKYQQLENLKLTNAADGSAAKSEEIIQATNSYNVYATNMDLLTTDNGDSMENMGTNKDYEILKMHCDDIEAQLKDLQQENNLIRLEKQQLETLASQNTSSGSKTGQLEILTNQVSEKSKNAVQLQHSFQSTNTSLSEYPFCPYPITESTDYEYLREILIKYMTGIETETLSKVVGTVMRFTMDDLQKIVTYENERKKCVRLIP